MLMTLMNTRRKSRAGLAPETADYQARMTTQPTELISIHADALVKMLKATNLWSVISAIGLPMVHDGQAALLSLKSDAGNLTDVNNPLHVPYQGFQGNGTTSYLQGPTIAALDAGLTNGNFGIWAFWLSAQSNAGVDIGISNSANLMVNSRDASGNFIAQPLSATGVSVAVESSYGLSGFGRIGATQFGYSNGAVIPAAASTAIALPSGNLQFMASQNVASGTRILAAWAVTKGATTDQIIMLDFILSMYVDTIQLHVPNAPLAARFTCNFIGANGATTAVDEGGGKVITFNGYAAITTTNPLDGTSSLNLPGPGSFVSMPDSPDWQLPLVFSIMMRGRLADFQPPNHFSCMVSHWEAAGDQRSWQFLVRPDGKLAFAYSTLGTDSVFVQPAAGGGVVEDRDYEWLVTRDESGKIRVFQADITDSEEVHADMVASATYAGDFWDNNAQLRIGDTTTDTNSFLGQLGKVRIWKNEAIVATDIGYDVVPITPVPPVGFKVVDIMRYNSDPDLSSFGLRKFKVGYASEWWPSGASRATPNASYITNTRVPQILNSWPGITHLIIDIEHWPLFDSSPAVVQTMIGYHLTVVNAIRAGVAQYRPSAPDILIAWYGEVPIRNLSRFTGSNGAGSGTGGLTENENRANSWMAQNDAIQAVTDSVDFLAPSCYMIGGLSRNWDTATQPQKDANAVLVDKYIGAGHDSLNMHINSQPEEAKRIAPGKECWTVLWNEYHNLDTGFSPVPARPVYFPAEYWRIQLDAVLNAGFTDRLAIWSRASGSPVFNYSEPWWLETLDFIDDNSITI